MRQGDPMESGKHHLCMGRAEDSNGLEFSMRVLQGRGSTPEGRECVCLNGPGEEGRIPWGSYRAREGVVGSPYWVRQGKRGCLQAKSWEVPMGVQQSKKEFPCGTGRCP